jgi:hypothetical protein
MVIVFGASVQGASAQWGPLFGGTGGVAFTEVCSSTQHVRQMRVRAGSHIDGLSFACNVGDDYTQNQWKTWHGGSGGTYYDLYCGKYMTGITTYADPNRFVNAIRFTCYPSLDGGVRSNITEMVGARVGTFAGYYCPTGYAVTAYRGRSGQFLDRIGTYCAPRGPN